MKYVVDTSVIVEKVVSDLLSKNQIEGTILVPHAVIAELENQANKGLEIGFLGLEELQNLRENNKIKIEFIGNRPNEKEIKFAKSGEIDALIREIAYKEDATLITADKVQSESAKAFGVKVKYIELRQAKEKLEIEKYFDEKTMSVHIKEDCFVYGKRGEPGNWELEKISNKKLNREDLETISKEIVEKSRIDPHTFVEIARRGITIIQYKNYRIVIVKPPISDGLEITAVRPIKKLGLDYYKLPQELADRLKVKAKGVILAGETGSGKSTFAQALGEFYLRLGKIVKTVESPRDLQLPDEITQYSKNFTSSEGIHDILFLSRPDYVIFDEMRDTPDFDLYTDLRLGGSNVLGVLHSASPIDGIQRFISRLDTGMIPSVVDTIIFIEAGKIKDVYGLSMIVKVPTGMTESDLSRPIVEVKDFNTGKLKYEIYSYGEETVVIPVEDDEKPKGISKLASNEIEREFRKYTSQAKVDVINGNKAIVYVLEHDIAKIIGAKGKTIDEIEKKLGIRIDIRELKKEKNIILYEFKEDKKFIIFFVEAGKDVDFFIDDEYIFTAIASKKGEIRVHKQSKLGRDILKAMSNKKRVDLRI
ncbi:MAG: PINc/VapC family ATPase [Candidatus Woesearchaeota archaeon]